MVCPAGTGPSWRLYPRASRISGATHWTLRGKRGRHPPYGVEEPEESSKSCWTKPGSAVLATSTPMKRCGTRAFTRSRRRRRSPGQPPGGCSMQCGPSWNQLSLKAAPVLMRSTSTSTESPGTLPETSWRTDVRARLVDDAERRSLGRASVGAPHTGARAASEDDNPVASPKRTADSSRRDARRGTRLARRSRQQTAVIRALAERKPWRCPATTHIQQDLPAAVGVRL